MSDLVTQQIFSNGEQGITATKVNNIIGQAQIQTDFVASKPLASSVGVNDQFLILTAGGPYARTNFSTITSAVSGSLTPAGVGQAGVMNALSGLATDYVGGDNACHPLASAAGLTQMRLRSWNAIGNSNFECDARNVGVALTNPANGTFFQDRYSIFKSGTTGTVNTSMQSVPSAPIALPGTSFAITQAFRRFTVGTAQATLAAGDTFGFTQAITGPRWRELSLDVHSLQVLVSSTVAGLTFCSRLRDSGTTRSLVKLCTIPTANTWTLITLPNLPVWVGTYSAAWGQIAYLLDVFLACGSTYLAAANPAWQNGDIRGVTGMNNFLATSGAIFDIAFLQHEPGAYCTTPIDSQFVDNLDECSTYFSKSWDYATAVGTQNTTGAVAATVPANANPILHIPFKRRMAKDPTVTCFSTGASGGSGTVWDVGASAPRVATPVYVGEHGFGGASCPGQNPSVTTYTFHYTADTGW